MSRTFALPIWPARAAFVLIGAFVSMFVYLVFFELPWLSYTNIPFPVLNSPVRVGMAVEMRVSRCSAATITRVYGISRTLHGDGADILLPAGVIAMEPGCNLSVSAVNIIPLGTPAGTYILRGFGEIQGVVRTNSVAWESQPFEVVP